MLEKEKSSDFDDEMFDLLPINCTFFYALFYGLVLSGHQIKFYHFFFVNIADLNESMSLEPIEPNFHQYEIKEFFNLIVRTHPIVKSFQKHQFIILI